VQTDGRAMSELKGTFHDYANMLKNQSHKEYLKPARLSAHCVHRIATYDMQDLCTQHTGQHYTYQHTKARHNMKCETVHIHNSEHNIYILPVSVVVPALIAALQDSQPESRKLYQF